MSAFMEHCRKSMRAHNLAYRTEQSYGAWIRRYILFHNKQRPQNLNESAVQAFLTHLAAEHVCASATQSQALCALVFLYKNTLETPLGSIGSFALAKRQRRIPVVLSVPEVTLLLQNLHGVDGLVVRLLYGSGLRVSEAGIHMVVQGAGRAIVDGEVLGLSNNAAAVLLELDSSMTWPIRVVTSSGSHNAPGLQRFTAELQQLASGC